MQHIVKVSTTKLLSALELFIMKYKVRQLLKINVLKWGSVQGCLVTGSLLLSCFAHCAATADNNRCASKLFSVCTSSLLLKHQFLSDRVWLSPHSKVINQIEMTEHKVNLCNLSSYSYLEQCTGTGLQYLFTCTTCLCHCKSGDK